MSNRTATLRSVLITVAVGLLVGFLLWKAYHVWRPVTDNAIAAVVSTRNALFLASILGGFGRATLLLVGIIMILRSLTGGLILGLAVGLALPRMRHRRLLCYSVLAWPAGVWCWAAINARWAGTGPKAAKALALWESRGEYMLEAFYIYTVFFALLVLVYFVVRQYEIARHHEVANA
ncbi:MAG: hypothetical protein JWR21_2468 [Herminiimonas sp.]|nr:hypothetical protein [Herminiimonas sp.]MDB5852247.1 hypothetical protein [Herminiimonas sp.]